MPMSALPKDPFFFANKDVVIGKNDHLFLYNGGHRSHSYHTGAESPSHDSIQRFQDNMINRAGYCSANEINFLHLIFPNKQSSLADLYPADIISVTEIFTSSLSSRVNILDFGPALAQYGERVWLKTDTHLNQLGQALMSVLLAQAIEEDDFSEHFHVLVKSPYSSILRGDLSLMLGDDGVDLTEEQIMYRTHWNTNHFNNSLPGGNNGITDIYINDNAVSNKRVLFFGDSFGRSCARLLSYFFSHVLFCRTPFMHYEIADMYQPHVLLTQSVERYLPSTPSDDNRPIFLLYPMIGKHWKAHDGSQRFYAALNAELCYPRYPYSAFIESLQALQ